MSFGLKERLKKVHNEKQINYTYFANELGISRQMFYRWTLDENNPNHRRLSQERKIKLDELLKMFE